MVRTKADGARKAVAAKAPRKALRGNSSGGSSSSSHSSSVKKRGRSSGGSGFNHACARPTPTWQKGIDGFLQKGANKDNSHDTELENKDEVNLKELDVAEPVKVTDNENDDHELSPPSTQTTSSDTDSAEPGTSSSTSTSALKKKRRRVVCSSDEDE